MSKPVQSSFSQHDVAIWHTIKVNALLDREQLQQWPRVATTFAPQISSDEHMLAQGEYHLAEYKALGDGSYQHDSSFFFATGGLGLALTAGLMAGQAIGNSGRRNQAMLDSQPRWVVIDNGQTTISQHGMYFMSTFGLRSWTWDAITSLELVGPGAFHMNGNSTTGPVSWVIGTDWAELVLTLWARRQHPHHPQFVGGTWIPGGWAERAAAAGYSIASADLGRHTERARALPGQLPPST